MRNMSRKLKREEESKKKNLKKTVEKD